MEEMLVVAVALNLWRDGGERICNEVVVNGRGMMEGDARSAP